MKFKKDKKLHIRRLEKNEIIEAFKMMGNEYRMNILLLLKEKPGLTLDQINTNVGGDIKNIFMHTKKLYVSGLIHKKGEGPFVHHFLSLYGRRAVQSFIIFSKNLDV